MTDRDMMILELLTSVRYATTKQIQDIVFPSVSPSICYKRLNHLIQNKMLNRKYFNIDRKSNCYVYYLDKAPLKRNIKHELLITQFVTELIKQGHKILEMEKGSTYRGIRPDMILKIKKKDGNERIIFLEVQLSKHDCQSKYFNLYKEDTPAILYIVTNNKIDPLQIRNLRVVIDDIEFSKLNFYFS